MAQLDLQGLLGGPLLPTAQPAQTYEQAMMQRGAQYGQGLRQAAGGLFGTDTRTQPEKIQEAAQGLNLNTPEGLTNLARLQQASGEYAAAARTASAARQLRENALKKGAEEKSRDNIAADLEKAGDPDTAALVKNGDYSLAQGASVLSQIRGENRRKAEQKEEKEEKSAQSIDNQILILKENGLIDSDLFDKVRNGEVKGLNSTEFNSLVNLELKERNNPVKFDNIKAYNLEDGTLVWGGKIQLPNKAPTMMYEAGENADGIMQYEVLPATAETPSKDGKKSGTTFTSADRKAVEARMLLSPKNVKGLPDNKAWSDLDAFTQNSLANKAAVRTNELVNEGEPLDKARDKAIKEVFLDNIVEVGRSILGSPQYGYVSPEIPEVRTQADYDALPSGAIYINNGQEHRKP